MTCEETQRLLKIDPVDCTGAELVSVAEHLYVCVQCHSLIFNPQTEAGLRILEATDPEGVREIEEFVDKAKRDPELTERIKKLM